MFKFSAVGRADLGRARTDVVSTCEALEPRQHLDGEYAPPSPGHGGTCACAGCGPARVATGWAVRVNFQPETLSVVPDYYRADLGRAFGQRGNGLKYGWESSVSSSARFRNDRTAPDLRHRSSALMTGENAWRIEVPPGTYSVSVVAGDPRLDHADYRLQANDQPLLRGRARPDYRWIEGAAVIDAPDGVIRLTRSQGATDVRLAFVNIEQIHQPAYINGETLDWSFDQTRVPLGRVEHATIRLGDKLYFLGGYDASYDVVYNRLDILDLRSGAWSSGAPLPGAQTHFGVAADEKFIYVATGQIGPGESMQTTTDVWRYDPARDRWTRSISLPEGRFGGTLAYHDNKLHFFGGAGLDRVSPTNTHWVLDYKNIDAGWQDGAPMPRGGDHLSSIVVDGLIYLVGGENSHGRSYVQHDNLFRYDPKTDTWCELAPLPVASSHFAHSMLAHEGRIWVFGGMAAAQRIIPDVRSYDIASNTWFTHNAMPQARKGGSVWLWDDRVVYAMGDGPGVGTATTLFSARLVDLT